MGYFYPVIPTGSETMRVKQQEEASDRIISLAELYINILVICMMYIYSFDTHITTVNPPNWILNYIFYEYHSTKIVLTYKLSTVTQIVPVFYRSHRGHCICCYVYKRCSKFFLTNLIT